MKDFLIDVWTHLDTLDPPPLMSSKNTMHFLACSSGAPGGIKFDVHCSQHSPLTKNIQLSQRISQMALFKLGELLKNIVYTIEH